MKNAAVLALALLSCTTVTGTDVREIQLERVAMPAQIAANPIGAILQDSRGFLWFGSAGHLVRYDGYEFLIHDPAEDSATGLLNRRISSLVEDREGNLWVGTSEHGLFEFDVHTGVFTRYRHDPEEPSSLGSDRISAVLEDSEGDIWVGAAVDGGLSRLDRRTGKFTRYRHDPDDATSLSNNRIFCLAVGPDGRLWAGSANGLNSFDRATESWTRFFLDDGDPSSLSGRAVIGLVRRGVSEFWALTSRGLTKIDAQNGTFTNFVFKAPLFFGNDIAVATDGGIWIATAAGLKEFDPVAGNFRGDIAYPEDRSVPDFEWVGPINADDSGLLWVALWGGGLAKWDPTRIDPQEVSRAIGVGEAIRENDFVTALYEDRHGIVWVAAVSVGFGAGSGPSLTAWDPATGEIRRLVVPQGSVDLRVILSLREDERGRFWAGTNSGLLSVDRTADSPVAVHNVAELDAVRINALENDRNGALMVGTQTRGLVRLDTDTGGVEFLPLSDGPSEDPRSYHVSSLLSDSIGRLWIGSANRGLQVYLPNSAAVRHFEDPGLDSSYVTEIAEDRRGRLWVATDGDGLHEIDPETGVVDRFTTLDGLPGDSLFSVLDDGRGKLWLVTKGSLARLDPESRAVRKFHISTDQPRAAFAEATCKGRDGTIYLAHAGAIIAFHPDDIVIRPFTTPVVMTGITIRGVPVESGSDGFDVYSPSTAHRLRLDHRQNDITLTFAALDYRRPDRNLYAYMLEGLDREWHQVGSQRTATYPNLEPGEYVFRVKAANGDGEWSEAGAPLQIIVDPPWWRTWWGYSFIAIILIAGVMGLVKMLVARARAIDRLRLKEAEAAQLVEVDRMKSRFFSNISHEFRTPLTLLLGSLQEIERNAAAATDDVFATMTRNARRLLNLVNQLLDLSRAEVGQMRLDVKPGELVGFIAAIVSSFEHLAAQKKIALHTEFPEAAVDGWFDRDKLEKILVNLLSNAVKFTPENGSIDVTCEIRQSEPVSKDERRELELRVRDTGPGIPPDDREHIFDRFYRSDSAEHHVVEGTGIGLALVRELVTLHGGQVSVESEPGEGSTFIVTLPIDREAFSPEHINEPAPETPSESLEHESGTAENGSDHERPLLLVVEDHQELRAYVRDQLNPNFDVLEASDGTEGLERAISTVPDLVVSDVMMPGLDGFELCRRLKADQRTSHIPLILLTARSGMESRLDGLETGADAYLTKPFDSRELRLLVRNLIDQRRSLRERFSQQIVSIRPEEIEVTSPDQVFLARVVAVVEEGIDDPELTAERLAHETAMSRMQLHRKLKALTGMPPGEFVRHFRLLRAKQLLTSGFGNVSEVAFAVGFKDLSHFARAFRKQFGMNPSECLNKENTRQ